MPKNPYDDAFRNLAKVMEELLNNLSLDENPRFVGCTIITGPGEDPRIIQFDTDEEDEEITYELIESDECIYITADIPPSLANEPYADIQAEAVRICMGSVEVTVALPSPVNIGKSHYDVRNGIMDIVCHKLH
jgi:HSP20 family molecular chaperone IbpA